MKAVMLFENVLMQQCSQRMQHNYFHITECRCALFHLVQETLMVECCMLETSALQEMPHCSPGFVVFFSIKDNFLLKRDNIFTGQTGHKSSGELYAQPAKPPREASHQREPPRGEGHQQEPPQGEGHQLPALPDWQVEGELWRRRQPLANLPHHLPPVKYIQH